MIGDMQWREIQDLSAQLAEARKDTARLDWLEATMYVGVELLPAHHEHSELCDWRVRIDAARKGDE